MKSFFIAVVMLFAMFSLVGCSGDDTSNPKNVGQGTCGVVDYHNGVLYFPCIKDVFANSLSQYRESHPDLDVVSIAGNGTDTNGYDLGYFVVVAKKK